MVVKKKRVREDQDSQTRNDTANHWSLLKNYLHFLGLDMTRIRIGTTFAKEALIVAPSGCLDYHKTIWSLYIAKFRILNLLGIKPSLHWKASIHFKPR